MPLDESKLNETKTSELKQRPNHPNCSQAAPTPRDTNGIVTRSSSFISNTFTAQTQAMNAELQQAIATDALYVDRASDLLVEMYTTRRARIYASAVQKLQHAQATETSTGAGFGEVMSSCFALEAVLEPPALSPPESV